MSILFDPLSEFRGRRIGYARVSTPDQKLRSQCDWLRELNCYRIFADKGVSGSNAERPALNEMLDFIEAGDVVVVWRFDRLGRSVSNMARLLNHFDQKDVHFFSAVEGINTTSSTGRFVYHLMSNVAELQRNIIVENTIAGLEAAKARGVKLGRPRALSFEKALEAHHVITQFGEIPNEIAKKLNVSRITLDRTFKRYGFEEV